MITEDIKKLLEKHWIENRGFPGNNNLVFMYESVNKVLDPFSLSNEEIMTLVSEVDEWYWNDPEIYDAEGQC